MAKYVLPDAAKESPKKLLEYAVAQGIQEIDFRFTDLWGKEHHKTYMTSWLKEHSDLGKDDGHGTPAGVGFDGSSIPGWKKIYESDMLMVPDVKTAFIDPFYQSPTIVVRTTIHEPSGESYELDPRTIALRAEKHLRSLQLERMVADTAYFGPEPEFFIFDAVSMKDGALVIDSNEKPGKLLDHCASLKEGYFPVIADKQQDIRSEMVRTMEDLGLVIECQHHEVARTGQAEIDPRYGTLTAMADTLQLMKYVIHQVARKHGKFATFMPKIFTDDNGSGMHVHQSLWGNDKPLFAGDAHFGLSKLALAYAAGIIAHGTGLYAFTNPTTNSALRLVPGFEAPTYLALSISNRSAAIRIPNYEPSNPCAKRLEVRFPDPAANPYLAFTAMLLAGLDGITQGLHEVPTVGKKDLGHDLTCAEKRAIKELPGNLLTAHAALTTDKKWLTDVIPEGVVAALHDKALRDTEWIGNREKQERIAKEFELYWWV
ncbi:type I glutamate--ammonia ligase [Candidatus Woesearchaeota archaeon]|nr:type I glutamate--ammonia ligase [Candidatus Woesearchaeota archaeon]